MKKSEKRRIGEARQAANLRESIESGLKAQQQAHEIAAKRKATKEKMEARLKAKAAAEKAKESMREVGESASKAAKSMNEFVAVCTVDEEYPLVLDMTDETAFSG